MVSNIRHTHKTIEYRPNIYHTTFLLFFLLLTIPFFLSFAFQAWFAKSFSSCVLTGDLECQFNPELPYLVEHQLTYFCGSRPYCKQVGSRKALQRAKHNLENKFAVVGITSDLELSLQVMRRNRITFYSWWIGRVGTGKKEVRLSTHTKGVGRNICL